MISLHSYKDGAEILINLDLAQYVTSTDYRDVDGNQANCIVTFSEETCFYVKETLQDVKVLATGGKSQGSGKMKGCSDCYGSGGSKKTPCISCHGTGKVLV